MPWCNLLSPKNHGRSGDPAIWDAVPGRNHLLRFQAPSEPVLGGNSLSIGLIHTACIGEDSSIFDA